MATTARGPSMVGAILGDVIKRVDPEHQLPAYSLWSFWNDEVGAGIARRAQPARMRNGILFVTVANHSWMQELQFLKDQIREKLNVRLGAELVRDIYFVSGSFETQAPVHDPDVAPARSAPPVVELPPISDPEIAAAFARVVTARAKRLTRAKRVRGTSR